jgi:hypothetical protein
LVTLSYVAPKNPSASFKMKESAERQSIEHLYIYIIIIINAQLLNNLSFTTYFIRTLNSWNNFFSFVNISQSNATSYTIMIFNIYIIFYI